MRTQFKYVGDKHIGDTAVKDATLRLIVNPGDIVEVDTNKCIVKNITTGIEGRLRNKDMIQGNPDKGVQPLIERLTASQHYEKIKEEAKKGPGRPPANTNKEDKEA